MVGGGTAQKTQSPKWFRRWYRPNWEVVPPIVIAANGGTAPIKQWYHQNSVSELYQVVVPPRLSGSTAQY